ncbi:hypothetical protein FQZ97_846440 [compost metagenome]
MLLKQRFQYSNMEVAEHSCTAEHQRRTTEAMTGTKEEVLAFLQRNNMVIKVVDDFQRQADFLDVLVDQMLGAHVRAVVQGRLAHPGEVAMDTLVEGEHQIGIGARLAHAAQALHPLAHGTVIIVVRDFISAPVVHSVLLIQS